MILYTKYLVVILIIIEGFLLIYIARNYIGVLRALFQQKINKKIQTQSQNQNQNLTNQNQESVQNNQQQHTQHIEIPSTFDQRSNIRQFLNTIDNQQNHFQQNL